MTSIILGEGATLAEVETVRGPFDRWTAVREARRQLGLKPERAVSGDESNKLRLLGERPAHAQLKGRLADVARTIGWQTTLEAHGDGFRADVILERDGRRIACEVQLSPCPIDAYRERQDRYRSAGVEAFWFVGSYPEKLKPNADLPIFRVGWPDEESEPNVGLAEPERYGRRGRVVDVAALPLDTALQMLLDGRLRFAEHATVQPAVELIGWRPDCWKCSAEGSAWETRQVARTLCGLPHEHDVEVPDEWADAFSPAVRELACTAGLRDAAIKVRYSRTAETAYESFGCEECDALFGEWFIRNDYLECVYDPPIYAIADVGQSVSVNRPHWCTGDTTGNYCH
jgi:hypothetical protein